MTPPLQAAFLPLILDILALADRASQGRCRPVQEERASLRQAFDTAAVRCRGETTAPWELTGYALAAAVDELMIVEISWPGQQWWENNALEVELFGTRNRATEFFERAERAATMPTTGGLQVFLAAVSMGFRGKYRGNSEGLRTWLWDKAQIIRLADDRPLVPTTGPQLGGAAPLSGRSRLTIAILAASFAAMLFLVSWWWLYVLGS